MALPDLSLCAGPFSQVALSNVKAVTTHDRIAIQLHLSMDTSAQRSSPFLNSAADSYRIDLRTCAADQLWSDTPSKG
jgi:hypothetical protein